MTATQDIVFLDVGVAHRDHADVGLITRRETVQGVPMARVQLALRAEGGWFKVADLHTIAGQIRSCDTHRPAPVDSDYSRGWSDALRNLAAMLDSDA